MAYSQASVNSLGEKGTVSVFVVVPDDPGPAVSPGRPPARQASLRAANLALVLGQVCAAEEAPSRADIAQSTGLTRSTVSRLMDELVERQMVDELDPLAGGQRGRPAVPLRPAAGTWLGLGMQINVRRLSARLIDLAGNVLGTRSATGDFAGADPRSTVEAAAALGRELLAEAPVGAVLAGARVALPGLVDAERVLLRAPNLGWWDVHPRGWLAEGLGVPEGIVGLGNEADLAAVAMAFVAPGRPATDEDFLFISGEVGIGSALVTGGGVMPGRHGWAGEIGHVCVDADGPECACGARGCLERYAGLAALCEAAGVADREGLAAALEAGDAQAVEAVASAGKALGIVLAGALNLLDVSQVVLGGHLGAIIDYLSEPVLDELRRRVLGAPFAEPTLTAIEHDLDGPSTGASILSLSGLVHDPAAWLEAHRAAIV